MNNDVKKYRLSPVAVISYAIAVMILLFVCYQVGKMVGEINQYYAAQGLKPAFSDYFVYTIPAMLPSLRNCFIFFMLGYILDAVRKNNPANYKTQEEIEEEKIARQEAREARKAARGEAAAAKAGNIVEEGSSVEADFAKSLEEELKADGKGQFKQYKKPERKSGNNGSGEKKTVKKGGNRSANSRKKADGAGSGRNNSNNGGNNNNGGSNAGKNSGNGGRGNNANNNNHRGGTRKPAADKAKPAVKEVKEAKAPNEVKEAKAPKEAKEVKAPKEVREVKEAVKDKAENTFSAVISESEDI